jgi:uncharacterized BrkB/YihY/UPF0761 family membrane protein
MDQVGALIDRALIISAVIAVSIFLLIVFLPNENKKPLHRRLINGFFIGLLVLAVSMFVIVNIMAG